MTKTCYESLREAIGALELYETAYASSEDFYARKAEIAAILKNRAEGATPSPGKGITLAFAEALQSK